MKRILIVFLLAASTELFSQPMLIEFEVTNSANVVTAELKLNDSISTFKVISAGTTDDQGDAFLFKNKQASLVYTTDRFMNVKFHVRDTLHGFRWELLPDTLSILAYKCLAAKTYFRGRTYKAFYAPGFSVSDGPWKFGGLPGLILAVQSEDGYVGWKATKVIENYTKPIEPLAVSRYEFLDWDEFVTKYIATVKKFAKLVRSNGTLSGDATAKFKIDAVEIIYPELQTGEGITL